MNIIVSALLAVSVLTAPQARAEVPKKLDWDSLVPATEPLVDPFEHLTDTELYDLKLLNQLEQLGYMATPGPRYEKGQELKKSLRAAGLDVSKLLQQSRDLVQEIERRNNLVVNALDGELVRMPGYALPLEFEGTAVDQFLLVPYVGACIHVPAPPANQMIFVKLNQSYKPDDIYEPVWVTGRMRVKSTQQSLSLVDGTSNVSAGYTLEGIRVEPYEE